MACRIRNALLFGLIATLAYGAAAAAQSIEFRSGAERTTLVELYTSEGCSSCPPADRWLSQLKDDPGLWRNIIPLAFHVDYWDYIGWKDEFAREEHSARQRRYAWEGGANSVYTPGMFRNGTEWRGWWRGETPVTEKETAGRLTLRVDGRRLGVAFRPQAAVAEPRVHVALLGFDLSSRVTAGENDGRTLEHDFVVLAMSSAALDGGSGRYAAELSLPAAAQPAPRQALVAWVSGNGRLVPLQAVGGYLDGT